MLDSETCFSVSSQVRGRGTGSIYVSLGAVDGSWSKEFWNIFMFSPGT